MEVVKMEHSISIRKYQESDRAQVQTICLATGSDQATQNKAFQDMLLTAFCNYYIEQEPDNCFVATDGQKAIGYILCAENADVWAKNFQELYVDRMDNEAMKPFYSGIMNSPLQFASEYPAHLHIDILPEYQRMGIGSKLMNALVQHLKDKGIRGLMLSVACDNVKGRQFYKKYGFQVLAETPHEIVMGIQL
jgi:ribosomal protein S18 acetylase RimI-like enzyme